MHRVRTPLTPGAGVRLLARRAAARGTADPARGVRRRARACERGLSGRLRRVASRRVAPACRRSSRSTRCCTARRSCSARARRCSRWSGRGVVLSAVSRVVAQQVARWIPGRQRRRAAERAGHRFWRAARQRRRRLMRSLFASAMRLTRKKRPLRLVRAFAEAVRFVAARRRCASSWPATARRPRVDAQARRRAGVGGRVELPGQLSRDELRASMRARTRSCCRASTSRSASRRWRRGPRACR